MINNNVYSTDHITGIFTHISETCICMTKIEHIVISAGQIISNTN